MEWRVKMFNLNSTTKIRTLQGNDCINNSDKSDTSRTITVDEIQIHLREPDNIDSRWIGQKEVYRLLCAAWLKIHEKDRIMTPLLVCPPGGGKTTLACAVAKEFDRPLYLINCTSDMRPEDLLITPVLSANQQMSLEKSHFQRISRCHSMRARCGYFRCSLNKLEHMTVTCH